MIAIDTNILVRYLVEDDAAQAAMAIELIEQRLSEDEPGFIAMAVLVELAWVLKRAYRQSSAEIRAIVAGLIGVPRILVENATVVRRALALELPDLADAIIHEAGKSAGCDMTLTLDRNFAKLPGVKLLEHR